MNSLICNFSDLELNQKNLSNYRSIYLIELFSEATEIYVEEHKTKTIIRLNNNGLQKISVEHDDYDIYSDHNSLIFFALRYAQKCKKFSYISKIGFFGHSHINFYDLVELPQNIKSIHLENDIGLSPDALSSVTDLTINYYTFNLHIFPRSLKRLTITYCNEQFKELIQTICKKMEISLAYTN